MTRVGFIMHIRNEELLLPFILDHYGPQVDQAIIIDYGSTDASRDIIHTLAPHWEIRPSTTTQIDAAANDQQVYQAELDLEAHDPGCWKVIMNATEYLLVADFRAWLQAHADNGNCCVGVRSIIGVDMPEERPKTLEPGVPLWRQVSYGYLDDRNERRFRYVHNYPHGAFEMGRHGTRHPHVIDEDVVILFNRYAHMDALMRRVLQHQDNMTESDKINGFGYEHLVTVEQHEANWAERAARAYPLSDLGPYQQFLQAQTSRV